MTGEANLVSSSVVGLGDAFGVELGFGPVVLRQRGLKLGAKVLTLTRPEAIRITPVGSDDGHGVVKTSAFMGQSIRYSIAAGTNTFLVDEVSTRRLADGQSVQMRIDPDHVSVFPPQASQPYSAPTH